MSEMPHPISAEWLSAYYDGELDAARRQQLEAHLPGCAECQRQLAALKTLSETLAADTLAAEAAGVPLTDSDAFWRQVERRLPARLPVAARPAGLKVTERRVLVRWLPGFGLLLLNGMVQVSAVVGTVVMLMVSQLSPAPAWTYCVNRLAAASTLGNLAWLLPSAWSGLGLLVFFMMLSGGVVVLYLAWLGYELRYGSPGATSAAA